MLFQNNTNIIKQSPQTTYVSSGIEVIQKVELNAADFDYLNKSKSSITVYWFVDCVYQGNTTNFTFSINYTKPNVQHEVLGIVVADTVNKTITTPVPPVINTTSSPNISTTIPPNITTAVTSNISTSTVDATTITSTMVTTTPKIDVKYPHTIIDSTYTSECQQNKQIDLLLSVVQLENQQKYGYFSQTIFVKGKLVYILTFFLVNQYLKV